MAYEIQVLNQGEWTNDVTLLGHGCRQDDNLFTSQEEAIAAIADLAAAGLDATKLRVGLID